MFYVHLRKSHFATFLGSKMGHGGSSETGGELSFNLKHLDICWVVQNSFNCICVYITCVFIIYVSITLINFLILI